MDALSSIVMNLAARVTRRVPTGAASTLYHASQVFMDIPMRCMSYTGNDGRNKNLLAVLANDVITGDVNCYIFRCTSLVRRACRAVLEFLMLCRLWR